ncbi:hypothetical protein A4244_17335 [Bacillus badius]|nr:hypothetical protein A4244_17335 [Bacillus badius]OCS85862.1 hypothetical protein A6M11_17350 [Bacillus badius]
MYQKWDDGKLFFLISVYAKFKKLTIKKVKQQVGGNIILIGNQKKGEAMMWKNILSSIGIGGVAIDTVLEKTDYHAGEKMKGKVLINGGQAAEPIDALVISWYLQIHEVREDSDFSYHDKELKEMTLPIQRDIQPKEKLTIPFTLEIDAEHPPTSATHQTFLKTTAVIPQAVDPFDQDEVIILPKRK